MFPHTQIILFLVVFIGSFCITYFYKNWATRKSVLDIPNERSSHYLPTPRGGGIAIVLSFYISLSYLFLYNHIEKKLFFALLPGLILALVGTIDDIKSLSTSVRFGIQFLCAGIALYFLGGFNSLIGNNHIWFWSFTALIGFVWFINLFNFLDGSDGYASMEAISIVLALWFFTGMNVLLILAFSVGGFLFWNWPRARIFMGDVGSTTLGFILMVFGIYFHNSGILSFNFWILITALFWFDATLTLFRRFINKEKLSQAHKNHMYQRAIQGGFSHLKTMFIGLGINILLFLICYFIWEKYLPLVFGYIVELIILYMALKYVDKLFAFKK